MPELIVYDKRNRRLHINTAVKYRGMRCVVTNLISSNRVDIKVGAIVHSNINTNKLEAL